MGFDCLEVPDHELEIRYGELFCLADQVLLLCNLILENLDRRKLNVHDFTAYRSVLAVIYYKAYVAIRSVASLCARGLTEDAATVARKILEAAVQAEYIATDPQEREKKADLFQIHEAVYNFHRRLPLLRAIKDSDSLSDEIKRETERAIANIEQQYETYKDNFPLDKHGRVQYKYWDTWSGLSIVKMAEEVKGEFAEQISRPYHLYCTATHTSSTDIHRYFDFREKEFVSGVDPKDSPYILLFSCEMLLRIAELLCLEFDLQLIESIAALQSKIANTVVN